MSHLSLVVAKTTFLIDLTLATLCEIDSSIQREEHCKMQSTPNLMPVSASDEPSEWELHIISLFLIGLRRNVSLRSQGSKASECCGCQV